MQLDLKKLLICSVMVLLIVISAFPIANFAQNPANHEKIMASIDRSIENVLQLTAVTTAASASITLLPDDAATPIAEKLADFTEYFLVILCVLYAEKYALALTGIMAFRVLLPLALAFLAIGLYWRGDLMHRLAFRFGLVALAVWLAIPLSIGASDKINAAYQDSLDATILSTEAFTDQTNQLSQAGEDRGLFDSILEKLSESVNSLVSKATAAANQLVEHLAVMIVTSCIIPLLILILFIWIIKALTGIQLPKKRPAV